MEGIVTPCLDTQKVRGEALKLLSFQRRVCWKAYRHVFCFTLQGYSIDFASRLILSAEICLQLAAQSAEKVRDFFVEGSHKDGHKISFHFQVTEVNARPSFHPNATSNGTAETLAGFLLLFPCSLAPSNLGWLCKMFSGIYQTRFCRRSLPLYIT